MLLIHIEEYKNTSKNLIKKSTGFYENIIFVCEQLLKSESTEDEKIEYRDWIEKCNQKINK